MFNRWASLLIVLASALPAYSAAVPIPDNDPFYQPTAGYESTAPGTILKTRPSKSSLIGVAVNQILYRTTDANGNPSATVATILKGSKSSPNILVSYQDYEDATNTTCAPSYLFNNGQDNTPFGPTFGGQVQTGLNNGWTIVVPDYEGFTSAFAVGRLEGQAVLDGMRAALKFPAAGLNPRANIGGLGYSGGALATSWAAALQKNYAPELNVKGWAFGGTPANLTAVVETVDGTLFAGFGAAGAVGLTTAYPPLAARVQQIITPAGTAAFNQIKMQCATSDLTSFSFQTLRSTKYQTLGPRLLYDPAIVPYLTASTLGLIKSETPAAPVFMYHSNKDEVIPYIPATKTAAAWCSNGASVNFTTETGGSGHLGCDLAIGSYGINWLDLRVKGTPPTPGCSQLAVKVGGLPAKRAVNDKTVYIESDVLDRFGYRDEKVVDRMLEQEAAGEPVDNFYSYLRDAWKQ